MKADFCPIIWAKIKKEKSEGLEVLDIDLFFRATVLSVKKAPVYLGPLSFTALV